MKIYYGQKEAEDGNIDGKTATKRKTNKQAYR
jgi:hypothetical protein